MSKKKTTHTRRFIFRRKTVRVVGGKSAGCSSRGLLGAMLSFPPDLRSVQRGCQVHSAPAEAALTLSGSLLLFAGHHEQKKTTTTTTKNKSSVHGSARKSAADKSFSCDGAEHHWTVGGSDQVRGAEMTTTWTRRGWALCVPHSPRTGCARAKLWAENETPLLVCLFLKAAVPQIAPTPSPPPPSYLHPTDPSHRDGWLVRQRQ